MSTGADPSTQSIRQRYRELAILNEIAQELNRQVDLEQALQSTLSKVAELLDLRTGWVWLLHEHSGESYLAASQNLPPALADHPPRMTGSCYCLDTYRAGDLEGAANVNVVKCSRLQWLMDGTYGLKYHASIPLYAQGKRLGVLNVASPDWRQLSEAELRILYTLGELLSIAIQRARLFSQSMQSGAIEERNRLAREIHDTLAQGLAGISLHLETADALLEMGGDPESVRRQVQQALELTRANLEEARRSVLDLRAAPLEGRDLPAALAGLCRQYAERYALEVHFEAPAATPPLPARLEVGLYRIAQEALSNVAQHAQARRVQVQLSLQAGQARLVVADDGLGFDPAQIVQDRFGLLGLNERARLLGGELRIESQPGAGARLEIVVPLA
ncbi:MAG: GAF domain-containing sensor histidine kinase [Chloroflexota bacterium]